MRWVRRIWDEAQKRFAIVFTIGAALSFANILSSIQFVIDGWAFLQQHLKDVPIIDRIAHLVGATVAAALAWWRDLLHQALGWIGVSAPDWLVDWGSALSFILGRGFYRRELLRRELRAAEDRLIPVPTREAIERATAPLPSAQQRYRELAEERKRILTRIPIEVAQTVFGLALFFVALYLIDAWYRAG